MARARNIKPGLFKNEVLGVADPLYTLLFEGLWVLADREGRLEDRPLRIKAEVFPYRDADIDALLGWLVQNEFIVRYAVAGKRYIEVLNFAKHQNPHKNESESDIPSPLSHGALPDELGTSPELIGSTRADSLSSDSLNTHSARGGVDQSPTQAGLMCRAMKTAGIPDVNPGHPDLLALVAAGAEEAEFVGVAQSAAKKGKGFAYAIGTLLRQRTEAAEKAKGLHRGSITPQSAWHETASGIKAKGAELGIPWSEDGWVNGEAMSFPTYSARVKSAAGH